MALTRLDSRQIAFKPAGTGAVATNVQSKLREFVSVKDFGAVGDGVADDTVAIQAALNASGFVLVPDGVYLISSTITLPSNRHLLFSGAATFKRHPTQVGTNFRFLQFASTVNTTVENGIFDLNNASGYGTGIRFASGNNKNCQILGCRFYDSNPDTASTGDKWAISLGSSTSIIENILIDRCSVADTDNSLGGTPSDMQMTANGGAGGNNITISNCYVYKPIANGISMTYGFAGTTSTITNLQIINNYIYGPAGLGIVVGRDDGGADNSDVIKNVLVQGNTVDLLNDSNAIGIDVRPTINITSDVGIIGNTVYADSTTGQIPIQLTDAISGSTPGTRWIENAKVIGNTVGARTCNFGYIKSGNISRNYFLGVVNLGNTYDVVFSENQLKADLRASGNARLLVGPANVWRDGGTDATNNRCILSQPVSSAVITEADMHVFGNTVSNTGGSGNLEHFIIANGSSGGTFKIDVTNNDISNITANPFETTSGGSFRRIRDNIGYINANGGTSSAISSGGTIAHGLASTPTVFSAVPTSAAQDVVVTANATNLTVTFGGGGSVAFSWEAKMANYYGG